MAPQKVSKRVIGPAVAGMFYPRHEADLAKQVDQMLAEAKSQDMERLRALVCPHAGYEFSGKIAASGYKQLEGRKIRTVVILGPSHTSLFRAAAVADADAVATPLGRIPISAKAAELAKLKPFDRHPKCEVHRPQWWQNAPQELPAFGEETPFTWEHSVENQYPFLQRVLKDFEVVPVVFGQIDPEEAATALLKVLDDDTLLVASSDLTHYLPYDVARTLDTTTLQAVCSLSTDWLEEEEAAVESQAHISLACGKDPILTVMHVARQKGWKAKLLDYRNSGDTAGHKEAVVGYAAVAFYEPAKNSPRPPVEPGRMGVGQGVRADGKPSEFTADQRKFLLEVARKSVTAAAHGEGPPQPDTKNLAEKLAQPRACFVTLKKDHQLRGCVGTVFPRRPLCEAVIQAGRSAAVEDHRFPPVKPEELEQIEIEVSVLTLPSRLKFNSPDELLAKLRPGVDGVVLRVGGNQGLFLPQVWEQLPDKEQFLSRLAEEKAGLDPAAWKRQRGEDPGLSGRGIPGAGALRGRIDLALAVCCLGVSAFLTQVTLMRELLSVFSGNELVFGIVLGNWMLLTGLGSALGKAAGRLKSPQTVFVLAQVLVAVVPIGEIFLLRMMRDIIFIRGSEVGVTETVVACCVLLAPYCIILGYLLTLASWLLAPRQDAAGDRPAALLPRQPGIGCCRAAVQLRAGFPLEPFWRPLRRGTAEPACRRLGGRPLQELGLLGFVLAVGRIAGRSSRGSRFGRILDRNPVSRPADRLSRPFALRQTGRGRNVGAVQLHGERRRAVLHGQRSAVGRNGALCHIPAAAGPPRPAGGRRRLGHRRGDLEIRRGGGRLRGVGPAGAGSGPAVAARQFGRPADSCPGDGRAALRQQTQERYDVVILDVPDPSNVADQPFLHAGVLRGGPSRSRAGRRALDVDRPLRRGIPRCGNVAGLRHGACHAQGGLRQRGGDSRRARFSSWPPAVP